MSDKKKDVHKSELLDEAITALLKEETRVIEPLSEFVRHFLRLEKDVSATYGAHALTLVSMVLAAASAKLMHSQCMRVDTLGPCQHPGYDQWVELSKRSARKVLDVIDAEEVANLIRQAYGPPASLAEQMITKVLSECLVANGVIKMAGDDADMCLPGVSRVRD